MVDAHGIYGSAVGHIFALFNVPFNASSPGYKKETTILNRSNEIILNDDLHQIERNRAIRPWDWCTSEKIDVLFTKYQVG